jgi:hypothetical protein
VKIDVHIEHLLLDGVELTRREREALPAVVQRELLALIGSADRAPDAGARPDRAPGFAPRIDHIGRDVAIAVTSELPPAPPRGASER